LKKSATAIGYLQISDGRWNQVEKSEIVPVILGKEMNNHHPRVFHRNKRKQVAISMESRNLDDSHIQSTKSN